jgi:hypothetical protein
MRAAKATFRQHPNPTLLRSELSCKPTCAPTIPQNENRTPTSNRHLFPLFGIFRLLPPTNCAQSLNCPFTRQTYVMSAVTLRPVCTFGCAIARRVASQPRQEKQAGERGPSASPVKDSFFVFRVPVNHLAKGTLIGSRRSVHTTDQAFVFAVALRSRVVPPVPTFAPY